MSKGISQEHTRVLHEDDEMNLNVELVSSG